MKKSRLLLFLSLLGVGTGAFFYRSWIPDLKWFRITEVLIDAQSPLTTAEVRKLLPKLEGQNLLKVDGDGLIARLKKNSWVADVSVRKELPSRLFLTISAKTPTVIRQDAQRMMFLDDNGAEIDVWSAARATGLDLPLIAFERADVSKQWSPATLVRIVKEMQKAVSPKHRVSQLVPSDPPYFKLFLTSPPLEMLFSLHTWEAQMPLFLDVLSQPPRQIGQAHKINLVFPKKAVVSFPLSH